MTGSEHSGPGTIYIASWGRSGSTVLGSCLAAPSGSIAVGELQYLWDRGISGASLCGCLKPVLECEFWPSILDKVRSDLGYESVSKLAEVAIEAAPRLRHLPGLLRNPDRLLTEHEPYLRVRGRLHQVLGDAGYDTIVDSSKRPVDLLALTHIPEIVSDLTVIHLVRHPARTAMSWSVPKRDGSRVEGSLNQIGRTRALAYWYWWNRSVRAVSAHLPEPPMVVNWEDVALEPRPILEAIIGPDTVATVMTGPHEIVVQQSHQIGGNPSKLDDASGKVVLHPDTAPTELSRPHRLLLRREMVRLGYGNDQRR